MGPAGAHQQRFAFTYRTLTSLELDLLAEARESLARLKALVRDVGGEAPELDDQLHALDRLVGMRGARGEVPR